MNVLSPTVSQDEFRRKVANLVDPSKAPTGRGVAQDIREMSNQFICILCENFGDSLDRKTLWDKVTSALETSAAKCDDGDLDRFTSLCFEHIKADHAKVARCEEYHRWLSALDLRPDSWKQGFIRYYSTMIFAAIVHGRNAWEQRKELKVKAKPRTEESLDDE